MVFFIAEHMCFMAENYRVRAYILVWS
jgi:hypothetical protein